MIQKPIDPAAVQRFRCFQELSAPEAATLAQLLEPVFLPAGQILFHQGDPGDALYLLASGQVDVNLRLPSRPDYLCATLEAGTILGEISPLLNETRTATATARTDAVLWRLSRDALQEALGRGEPWATKFLLATIRGLANRLIAMNREVIALVDERKRNEVSSPSAVEEEQLSNRLFDAELLGILRESLV